MDRALKKDDAIAALIEQLSQQALAYAKSEYGEEHPLWRSIHDQLECFHCLGNHNWDACPQDHRKSKVSH